jgi:hypothetical protein
MATYSKGANGAFSGKVGSVIGSNWRNVDRSLSWNGWRMQMLSVRLVWTAERRSEKFLPCRIYPNSFLSGLH